ncbi:hypothetical protein D3C77_293980 [compost metagenome]
MNKVPGKAPHRVIGKQLRAVDKLQINIIICHFRKQRNIKFGRLLLQRIRPDCQALHLEIILACILHRQHDIKQRAAA